MALQANTAPTQKVTGQSRLWRVSGTHRELTPEEGPWKTSTNPSAEQRAEYFSNNWCNLNY